MKRIALIAAMVAVAAGPSFATTGQVMPGARRAVAIHHGSHHRVLRNNVRFLHKGASADRETQALNLLESRGYGSFTNFRAAGSDYTARAMTNGHAVNLRVDPRSGKVTVES
jgi:hypothetical protein